MAAAWDMQRLRSQSGGRRESGVEIAVSGNVFIAFFSCIYGKEGEGGFDERLTLRLGFLWW